MKVSIWPQFSSNHSSSYTIVGEFESADAAQQAKDVIQKMLFEIIDWKTRADTTEADPNMIEKAYAQKYGIKWDESIDWLNTLSNVQEDFQQRLREHLVIIGCNLVVDSNGETWQSGEQFERLMAAMGANTYARIEYMGFRIRLTCTAPNHEVAQTIYNALTQHRQLTNLDLTWMPTPWAKFHPHIERFLDSITMEQFQAAQDAWHLWYDIVRQQSGDDEDFLARQIERHTEESPILIRTADLWEETGLSDGTVKIEGEQVIFEETVGGTDLVVALPSFHKWLLDQGCEVGYEFLSENAP